MFALVIYWYTAFEKSGNHWFAPSGSNTFIFQKLPRVILSTHMDAEMVTMLHSRVVNI